MLSFPEHEKYEALLASHIHAKVGISVNNSNNKGSLLSDA